MFMVEVYGCERRARTVAAIKHIRQVRGLGLADAKLLVDEVYYGGRPVVLEFVSEPEAGVFASRMVSLGFSCRFAAGGREGQAAGTEGGA